MTSSKPPFFESWWCTSWDPTSGHINQASLGQLPALCPFAPHSPDQQWVRSWNIPMVEWLTQNPAVLSPDVLSNSRRFWNFEFSNLKLRLLVPKYQLGRKFSFSIYWMPKCCPPQERCTPNQRSIQHPSANTSLQQKRLTKLSKEVCHPSSATASGPKQNKTLELLGASLEANTASHSLQCFKAIRQLLWRIASWEIPLGHFPINWGRNQQTQEGIQAYSGHVRTPSCHSGYGRVDFGTDVEHL